MDEKFSQTVKQIMGHDNRYRADAYEFVNAAVTYTARKLERDRKPRGSRHVSGQELVEGTMDYAVIQFGFLAPEVLEQWGVQQGEDVGNIVYNMIGAGLLSAGPEDSRKDFQCHPDLITELRQRIADAANFPEPPAPPVLD